MAIDDSSPKMRPRPVNAPVNRLRPVENDEKTRDDSPPDGSRNRRWDRKSRSVAPGATRGGRRSMAQPEVDNRSVERDMREPTTHRAPPDLGHLLSLGDGGPLAAGGGRPVPHPRRGGGGAR